MSHRPTQKQLQQIVDDFNRLYPVGSKVCLQRDTGISIVEVEAPAQILSGHSAVGWFKGVRGCYSIENGRIGRTVELTECPMCYGAKTLTGIVRYAPGFSGPPVRTIDCPRCNGTGSVPIEQMAWIAHGKHLQALRHQAGIGLRAGAEMQGLKPSELSSIEQGQVDNLNCFFDWSHCNEP